MSITTILAKRFSNYDRQDSIGSKLRAKRIAPLLEMIQSVYNEHGCVNIIDIGGTEAYWNIVPRRYLTDRQVNITIVNLPGTIQPQNNHLFKFIVADGCDLQDFGDRAFHIAHSNSVVEHVGDWHQMVKFASELLRVSQAYFVQTPNYWFPIEPHCATPFFHWLPTPIRVWLVSRFQLGHWERATSIDSAVQIVESARLLDKEMFQELFKDARILTEKFLFMPKSFIAIGK